MPENLTAYIPSGGIYYHPPLERFLPPLPCGVISAWLQANTQPGDLIIDPLGSNPLLAIEAALGGRRVLFSRNNPILWLALEVLASAPENQDFQDAVNKLMLTRLGDQRLDEILESLYSTPCAECGLLIQPEGFIWEQGADKPSARIYRCPHCSDQGERPISAHDIENLRRIQAPGLHQARAFHRVMHSGDYEKESIMNALRCYLPRAIYVIMTMINRLDGMNLSKPSHRLLQAVLICVFDDGNSLWHWPPRSHRFLQLSLPARFLEKNLWLTINSCFSHWRVFETGVPVNYWPNLPDSEGGICLYQRRLAEKENLFVNEKPRAITTIFPRPNQAFWTLSALWSGWLWGRKAVVPMRSALGRRHYNWYWFAQAISASVGRITDHHESPAMAFGLLPQMTTNHYLGLLAGMRTSGMRLKGAAPRMGEELAQCEWSAANTIDDDHELDYHKVITDFLRQRGEPSDFQTILFHCLTELVLNNGISTDISEIDDGLFRQMQEKVAAILEMDSLIKIYKPSVPGASRWWLVDDRDCQIPVSERVEKFIRQFLCNTQTFEFIEIEKAVCSQFHGSLTPEEELVRVCLESYADKLTTDPHLFALLNSETVSARKKDLEEISKILVQQGETLGFKVKKNACCIQWIKNTNQVIQQYHLTITAEITETIMTQGVMNDARKIIVFPGSRSRLLEYRLRQDPRLSEALENNWQFLKFRYLRWMITRENLNMNLWENLLGGDPPSWDPPKQLQFF